MGAAMTGAIEKIECGGGSACIYRTRQNSLAGIEQLSSLCLGVCVRIVHGQSLPSGGSIEFTIGGDQGEGRKPMRGAERIDLTDRRQLHRVVTTQAVCFSQRHSTVEQRRCHLNDLIVMWYIVPEQKAGSARVRGGNGPTVRLAREGRNDLDCRYASDVDVVARCRGYEAAQPHGL